MRPDVDPLRGGSCTTLPPEVVDKYFFADPNENHFAYQTAKMICARCIVIYPCLENAIQQPFAPHRGVIAGTSVKEMVHLRSRFLRGEVVAALVDEALAARPEVRI